MRIFTQSLILTALLGLTACEPSGPVADIGDNIDKVADTTSPEPTPPQDAADNINQPALAEQPAVPKPVLNGQEAEQALSEQQTERVVAEEAQQRLDEILEDTLDTP